MHIFAAVSTDTRCIGDGKKSKCESTAVNACARSKVAGNSDLLEQFAQPTERDALEFQDFLELISCRLSRQNLQILQLTMQGWSMNRIADYLGVVTRTIRRRKQEIREALLPYLPDSIRQQVQDDDPIEHGDRDQP